MQSLFCPLWRAVLYALGVAFALSANAAGPEWIYAVRPGDTLIGVASDYLSNPNDWPKLQSLNQVSNPKRLMPGSKLRLPVALLKREAAVAEALHVQGEVNRIQKNGRQQAMAAGVRLETGDTLETAAGSSVSLRFVDGSRLLLTEMTRLTFTEMLLYGRTGMAQTILDLHRGSLDTRVTAQQKPSARYEIRSRALNLAVRGTDFRAHVDDSGQGSRGEVLSGMVQASGARGKAVALPAGFGTLASIGSAPLAPQALPAALDLGSLPEVLQHLPLRFEWRAASSTDRYRAQVFADGSFDRLLLDGVFAGPAAKWADLPD